MTSPLPGELEPPARDRESMRVLRRSSFPRSLRLTPLRLVPSTDGVEGPGADLALGMQAQEKSNWCWAAIAASVGEFYRTGSWSQCLVATLSIPAFPGSSGPPVDCCGSPGAVGCNTYGYLDVALETTSCFTKLQSGGIRFEELWEALSAGQPVCARLLWHPVTSGAAHFLVITGCATDGATGTHYLDVADPATGSVSTQRFSDPASDPGAFPAAYDVVGGQWSYTYFTADHSG